MKIAIAFAALFAVAHAGVVPITTSVVQPIAPITQYSSEPVSVVAAAHQTIIAQPKTVIAAPNTLALSHQVASPLAYSAYSSVASPLAYTSVVNAAPLAYAQHWSSPILSAGPIVSQVGPSTVQIAHETQVPVLARSIYAHAPAAVEYVAAPAQVVLAKGEATYVAKNLGAEHIAPLPGHDVSQTSLNLAPAA